MKRLFFCCIVLLTVGSSWAGMGRLYTSDKLSSTMMSAICQDAYGYIWVGTEYGLNKFDGYHFTTYFMHKGDSTEVLNNNISCIYSDEDGRLWIGSIKGLAQYDHKTDKFTQYKFPDGIEPWVSSITENSEGLIIGTAGYGLYVLRKGSSKIETSLKFEDGSAENYCSRLTIDYKGWLWRGGNGDDLSIYKDSGAKHFNTGVGAVVNFIQDGVDGLYIACLYGIMRYDYNTGKLNKAPIDRGQMSGNVSIRVAYKDAKGNIFLGTSGDGLFIIRNEGNRIERVANTVDDGIMQTANVNDILEDRSGNLWISCYNKGLYQFMQGEPPFKQVRLSDMGIKTGSGISSIAVDNKDIVWCTVQNNGVYTLKDTNIRHHAEMPDEANIVYYDKNGNYWICSENSLYSYNPNTKETQKELDSDGWGIYCMTDNGEGELYLSVFGKGMTIYDSETGTTRNITAKMPDNDKEAVLCNNWIKSLYYDSQGYLWVGTTDGLSCFDTNHWETRPYEWSRLLKGYICTSITEAPDGNIIIGTNEGVFTYEKRRGQIEEFTDSSGYTPLSDKDIYGLVFDRNGDLWMSTTDGIWVYDRVKGKILGYRLGNGLTTKEYRQGAVFRLSNDMLGFGTNEGFTFFQPNDVKELDLTLGEVYLTSFRIGNEKQSCLEDSYTIPYGENTFSMEFSLLDYTNTENITFEYCLNDGEWTAMPEGTNAIYLDRVIPGKYKMDIRASNNGMFSEKYKTLYLDIKGPWYKSTTAVVLYLIVCVGILTVLFLYYKKRKTEELREAMMHAKTTEATSVNSSRPMWNYHIMVVDDDIEIGKYIKKKLSDQFRFSLFTDGNEALKSLLQSKTEKRNIRYDMVVSDVVMPDIDGITLLRKIKQNPNTNDIPVILISSKGTMSDKLAGLKYGADAYLFKPFDTEELYVQITNIMDNRRRLRGKYSGNLEQAERIDQVEVKGYNDVLMERIMKVINDNLTNSDFNVEMLAEKAIISRTQLHRKMKEITGISTSEFIRNLRLQQAARLIREGKINITQVAYAVGYNNQPHFSTVFRKHFGMTPTEYAESINKKDKKDKTEHDE